MNYSVVIVIMLCILYVLYIIAIAAKLVYHVGYNRGRVEEHWDKQKWEK